jgi:arginine-tRNA-protein transferase
MCTKWEDFSAFLYDSPVPSREVTFREPDSRLIGVAIVDLESGVMSSVYNYYEPESGRASLGSWMILWLLDFCRVTRLRWYYPGYHVEGCAKMNYKVAYRPYELGDNEGNWVRHGGEPAA